MLILIIVFILIQIINYHIMGRKLLNASFIIMGPYVIIACLNNLFFVDIGFLSITQNTFLFLVACEILFYIGDYLGQLCSMRFKYSQQYVREPSDHMLKIISVKYYILIVCCLQIIVLLQHLHVGGYSGMLANDFALFQPRGIMAHLLLSIKPLTAVLFYEWTKNKKNLSMISIVLLAIVVTASSFIKYHIISLVLFIFIYICLNEPKKFIKSGILVMGFVFSCFILNYFISFLMRNIGVNTDFYLLHLWKYIAGGTINTDLILENQAMYALPTTAWMKDFFMPLPAMFISKVIPGYSSKEFFLEMLPVTITGAEASNVISMLGFLACQSSVIFGGIFIIIWGWCASMILRIALYTKGPVVMSFASVFLTYNILSFFSSFFRLSSPWEELVWSIVIIYLFKRNIKITRRRIVV